jgi:hypothetical protein
VSAGRSGGRSGGTVVGGGTAVVVGASGLHVRECLYRRTWGPLAVDVVVVVVVAVFLVLYLGS